MCGIAGVVGAAPGVAAEPAVARALAALRHRGPDGEGAMSFAGGAAGMVRLALVDLSPRGSQPLWSADRRAAILFNGEAYDFRAERARLEGRGHRFASASDTEVVLALYREHGLDFVHHLRGMYALAIFDWGGRGPDDPPTVVLARDPFGIKPLYVAERGGMLLFASELRALLATGLVERRLDPAGVASYLDHGFLVQPLTMVRGVRMMVAGTLEVTAPGRAPRVLRFATLPPPAPVDEDLATAAARLRATLEESVALHSCADAEVGAFLSGGVDSTAVVALMRRHCARLRTFTLSFPEAPELDEAPLAAAAARALGCEHETVAVDGAVVAAAIERFAADLDQPSFDGLNTWLVARAAARRVKGVLFGVGGDEWFAGYPAVREMAWLAARRRPGLAAAARTLDRIDRACPALLPRRLRALAGWHDPLALWLRAHTVFSAGERQRLLGASGSGDDPRERVLAAVGADSAAPERESAVGLATLLDARVYMQSQLLRDADATSMAHSLELRVPLVDRAVATFARSCRDQHKLDPRTRRGGDYATSGAKSVLIAAVADLLPADLARRPKRGFTLPFQRWLEGPLAEVLADTCSPAAVGRRGLLDPCAVGAVLADARRGAHRAPYPRAWSLMILELWCRGVLDRPSPVSG